MLRPVFYLLLFLFSFPLYATQWQHQELKNGLAVFVKEEHRAPLVLVNVWYRVGSADEPDGITGISHMLEHMMFQGTLEKQEGTYGQLISAQGGAYNAFTTEDLTAYFALMSREYLDLILDLESDRMAHLQFDQTFFDKEKKVVREERRMRIEDQPLSAFAEEFSRVAYGERPYGHPVIGWAQDIQNYKLQDYQTWYEKWYQPNNAIVMIIGDVSAQEVFKKVEEKFGSIENHGPRPISAFSVKEPRDQSLQFEMKQKTEVPALMIGYSVPVLQTTAEEYQPYALALLTLYLAGNQDALLVRTLVRDRLLATQVDATYDPFARLDTQLILTIIPAQRIATKTLKKAVLDLVQHLKDQVIAEDELRRLKAQFKAHFIYQQDELSQQVATLGQILMANQNANLVDQFLDHIQAITPEQIQSVVRTYCIESGLTIGILLPESLAGSQP